VQSIEHITIGAASKKLKFVHDVVSGAKRGRLHNVSRLKVFFDDFSIIGLKVYYTFQNHDSFKGSTSCFAALTSQSTTSRGV